MSELLTSEIKDCLENGAGTCRNVVLIDNLRAEIASLQEKLREAEDKLQDAQLKPKTVYTVTMYRYGNREWHSYVLGAFSSNDIAREWAAKEEEYRGGKYKAEIIRWGIDSPTDFLKGEL